MTNKHSQDLTNFEVVLTGEDFRTVAENLGASHADILDLVAQMRAYIETVNQMLDNPENYIVDYDRESIAEEEEQLEGAKLFEPEQFSSDIVALINLLIEKDQAGLIEIY